MELILMRDLRLGFDQESLSRFSAKLARYPANIAQFPMYQN